MYKTVIAISTLFIFSTQSTQAIVIRHDINPDSYLADETDFPGVFNLITSPQGNRDCPVTLIAESWGITAAHCIDALRSSQAKESDTTHPVTINGVENAVVEVVLHPTWDGQLEISSFDMALVRLENPVTEIPPFPLYESDQESGKIVTLIGWGGSGNGLIGVLAVEDGKFRKANNQVDEVFETALVWDFTSPDNSSQNLQPFEGVSGPGDSGGPAFIETPEGLTLIGISSGQDDYENFPGGYGVLEYYARISTAVDWIKTIIQK